MTLPRVAGVIGIGEVNAKLTLVDLESLNIIAVRKTPNTIVPDGPYPHFDVDRLWEFLTEAIAELNREHPIDALTATTHGAAAALIDAGGGLALPVLPYEYDGPDEFAAEYDAVRPDFGESLTPRLPDGLNLGAQLFWQSRRFAEAFGRTRAIITYPQYWTYRLSGVIAAEITSLGSHTDLWNFETNLYSSLVARENWLDKMPEVRPAYDVLGLVKPDLATRLGLSKPVPVHCGIHNSNASLLPQLLQQRPPFAVVSTGTWIVVTAPGGDLSGLDPARDCLANIDAFGRPVPSARFMGGREFSLLVEEEIPAPSEAVVLRVLEEAILLTPSLVGGTGPFPDREATWSHPRDLLDAPTVLVAASFYLALMTAECLTLAGAQGEVIVEGPCADNQLYLEMLTAATARPVVAMRATGETVGAALLAFGDRFGAAKQALAADGAGYRVAPTAGMTAAMVRYAERWHAAVRQG